LGYEKLGDRMKIYKEFEKLAEELKALVSKRIPLQKEEYLDCPRAKSDMTPCVARDGCLAMYDNGDCLGCNENILTLLEKEREKHK
jgi:hypothetical protein